MAKRWLYQTLLPGLITLALFGWLFLPARPAANAALAFGGGDTYRAQVTQLLETGTLDLGQGVTQPYQIARVQVLEGPFIYSAFEIDYGRRQVRPPGPGLRAGEQILVTVAEAPGQQPQAFFVDFVRSASLLWLLGAFVAVSLLISGWKAARSLAAMVLSLTVILGYLLPRILAGDNPVGVSVLAAFVILASTLYLVYGWTPKTHAAVLGMLLALTITGALAAFFSAQARLTGFSSEAAMFLSQQTPVNLRGVALAGMLIGALGVLDDLVITQASAVFELRHANPALGFTALFRSGMRIGQDHVAATVNTLVLAYAGAALPLLLLVALAGEQWSNFLNREFMAEEVVSTLVGSLGLMLAVPLTTALAAAVALGQDRLGRWRAWLGPESDEPFGHQH